MASEYIVLALAVATLVLLMHSSVMVTGCTGKELFNETFDVTRDAISYVKFIEKLHEKVKGTHKVRVNSTFSVPMLPPEKKCHNNYFRVLLISDERRIRIQIQQVNLYFVAFQGFNHAWYEFKHERETKYVIDSEMLSFTASYPTDGIEKFPVGLKNLKHAISELSKYKPKDKKELVTLMVMIPEAIRFRPVTEEIERHHPQKLIIGPMQTLFKNWGKISSAIWLYEQTGTFSYSQPADKYGNITTVDQAVSIVRILLYQENKKPPKQPKKDRAATAVAVVTVKKKSQLRAVDKKSEEYQRVPNTCPRGSHFKAPCSCHHLIQEDYTFDHCMVGEWWKYPKRENSTNTCSTAQD